MANFRLTQSGQEVQDLLNAIPNKANKDGYYATMGVGTADNLAGKGSVMATYTRRASGGTADIGSGAATIKSIHGNTIVWNQFVKTANKSGTNTVVDDSSSLAFRIRQSVSPYTVFYTEVISSPKIVQTIFTCTADCDDVSFCHTGHTRNIPFFNLGKGLKSGRKYYVNINFTGVDVTAVGGIAWDNAFFVDLTQMFGSGNEPSTVAEFKALFPLNYYAYNIGELLSFNGTGIMTNGFNQWDEEWELGGYAYATGLPIVLTDCIRSKNRNRILPNTTYFCNSSAKQLSLFYYDADDNFISYVNVNNSSVTTPANAYCFRFAMQPTYGTTYNHDICINLSHSGIRNGEYEAYWTSTLALPISTYFANGMRSAGDAYDELTPSKKIVRIGAVDLGSLTWNYDTSQTYPFFYTSELSAGIVKTIGLQPVVCSKYARTSLNANMSDNTFSTEPDGTYAYHYSGNGIHSYIYIKDTSFTDVAAFKASLSGVYLVYELATPTETAISPELSLTYRVDDFGTENLLPENTSTPTTSPIVYDVKYAMNAADTIRNLDKNYENQASMDALLNALGTALHFTWTKTWDNTNRKYTYTIAST